jgi:O-antigen/teichoic acid export membrane protein
MLSLIQKKLKAVPGRHLKIGKNAAFLFGLNGFRKVLGLATTYFLVRALSQESYGEYNFLLSVVGLLSIFALPGLNEAIMQSVARGKVGTYRAALPLGFFSSFLGSLILFGFGVWYWNQNDLVLATTLFFASAVFPFAHGLEQWRSIKTGQEDFVSIARWEGAISLVTALLIIGGIHLIPGNILVPLGVILLVKSMQNLWLTCTALKRTGKNQPAETGSLSYGVKTSFYSALGLISMYIDKLLLFFFLSPASLAIYVVAERFPKIIKNLIKNLATVVAPRFAKHRHYTPQLDTFIKYFSGGAAIFILVFAFAILPWLVILIFGESYREAVPYAQALMCTVAIANSVPIRIRFIKSKLDAKSFKEIITIMSVTRILTSFIFIPTMGLTGAVIAVFLSRIITTATVHYIIKNRYLMQETVACRPI